METRSVYPLDLEIRQVGGRPVFSGSFPYGDTATIARSGRVRKEQFAPHAFQFAIDDLDREINFLVGHSFNRPLASRKAGTLAIEDRAAGVFFEATLPPEGDQPSWVVDFIQAHRAGMVRGISPGFAVPPLTVVSRAEEAIPEPGNPGVYIRRINAAVLGEFSAVTRPTYDRTALEERAEDLDRLIVLGPELEILRWL